LGACFAFVNGLDWIAGEAKPTQSVQATASRQGRAQAHEEKKKDEGAEKGIRQRRPGTSFDEKERDENWIVILIILVYDPI
jgi:hypothetical protein